MKEPKQAKRGTRRSRSTGEERSSSASSPADVRNIAARSYKAYAVARDGTRKLLDARSIVVELGDGEVELGLEVLYPLLDGELHVRVNGWLVVGHGDASSVYIRREAFGEPKCGRRKGR